MSRARARPGHDGLVSSEDLENYETEAELALYREYRDVVGLFSYVVETDRRFYLCNKVDLQVRASGGDVYFEVTMADAWVWDVYRSARSRSSPGLRCSRVHHGHRTPGVAPGAPNPSSPVDSWPAFVLEYF